VSGIITDSMRPRRTSAFRVQRASFGGKRHRRDYRALAAASVAGLIVCWAHLGCRSGDGSRAGHGRAQRHAPIVRRIACIYDQKPWINLDLAGDRDPEGVSVRVFLDPGTGRGVLVDGTFHIEMYRIDRSGDASQPARKLISDWHYASSEVPRIARPGMLGNGYVLQLRWATKDVPGHEIELITRFEDRFGNLTQAGTKRLRVPKYAS